MNFQMFFGIFMWFMYIIMFLCMLMYAMYFRIAYKNKKGTVENVLQEEQWAPYAEQVKEEMAWFEAQEERKQLYILTRDKIRLNGWYLPAKGVSRGRVILMHDYRTPAGVSFAGVLRAYHERGFDVLLCDQRAHGESLGKYICFGARERFDCKLWVECMNKLYGDDKPTFLHGVGMGGTAVLMTAGLKLPYNVTAVIAEGAYTSPYAMVKKLLKKSRVSGKAFLGVFDFWCRALAGYKLKGASTQAALRETKLPVLLIHGSADEKAPYAMAEANYAACAGEKQLVTIPDAGHGVCLWAAEKSGLDMFTFVANHEALPEKVEELPESAEESVESAEAPAAEADEDAAV